MYTIFGGFHMFNKEKFANIVKSILSQYNNQNEFSNISELGRAYISRIINMRLLTPPKPITLRKIATASKGVTTYEELMQVCGYVEVIDNFFEKSVHQEGNSIPIIDSITFENNTFVANHNGRYIELNDTLDPSKEYFAYKVSDNSMLPLLDVGDIAVICKQTNNTYESGKTYLLMTVDNLVCIRKILKFEESIELHAMNPYYPVQKLTKENFKIIGKVIKAENKSAFK